MSNETLAIIASVVSSAVGVSIWITTQLTELKTEVKHAFLRIAALEDAANPPPRARQRKR